MDKSAEPVRQKKRNFSMEKNRAVEAKFNKLLEADFIEPCQYPEWVENVVMVPKHNGTLRMCVDFTNLNKAWPKEFYPLPG